MGAVRSEACPNPMGPDLDIGNSPILKSLPGGKRALIVGTKQGHVIALDPDNKGAVLYRVLATTGQAVAMGGGRGGTIVWGGAADDQNVYYGAGAGTGLVALRWPMERRHGRLHAGRRAVLVRRPRQFPECFSKAHRTAGCSRFRLRMESRSGSSIRLRNS